MRCRFWRKKNYFTQLKDPSLRRSPSHSIPSISTTHSYEQSRRTVCEPELHLFITTHPNLSHPIIFNCKILTMHCFWQTVRCPLQTDRTSASSIFQTVWAYLASSAQNKVTPVHLKWRCDWCLCPLAIHSNYRPISYHIEKSVDIWSKIFVLWSMCI